jgi:hypothetical protein
MKADYLSPRTSLIKWRSALLAFSFLIGPPKARQDLSRSIKVWLDDIGLLAEAVSAHFTDLTDPSKTVLPSKLNTHFQTGSRMLLREAVAVI